MNTLQYKMCGSSLKIEKNLPPAGVEPATLGLLDPRSNRLSYGGLGSAMYIDSPNHLVSSWSLSH